MQQYEGRGDSPFGVVDMVGNVWEWCLTDYDNRTDDLHSVARNRVVRGGSWVSYLDYLRAAGRSWGDPGNGGVNHGFRCALLTAAPVSAVFTTPPSAASVTEATPAAAPARPHAAALMPEPFAWVEIPGGRGTIATTDRKVMLAIPSERYWISKYPVTNAQYAKYIEAGGYRTQRWWTEAGWAWRNKWKRTEPRYWRDSAFNGLEQPIVGVSWFEAVAFCLWLSEASGERIMLPTEAQWQYAAQGKDGRKYPWGSTWDAARCNHNEGGIGVGRTTPVRQYEGKGDSPFGVVDMSGNVFEWCLIENEDPAEGIYSSARLRVLRGGSWTVDDPIILRATIRMKFSPGDWLHDWGFRLALSP